MLRISSYLKIVPKRHFNLPIFHTPFDIRHQFLDFFIKSNNHSTLIRSSPVVQFCDAPKYVFQSKRSASYNRSVNSPVVVEEKQNDVNIVATDGCLHNVFAMLVNWSFLGNFFKQRGECELAWNLLGCPVRNNSSRLYATHSGDRDERLRNFVDIEMKNVLENSPKETHPFIVHFLTCATLLESVHLQKATRFCTDRPIIVLSSTDDHIRARCCVPQQFVTEKFSAFKWLCTVANVFETEVCPSTSGLNKEEICHLKPKKLTSVIFDEKLEAAMQQASDFARIHM